jgi:preprotein translocase subunit SecE
MAVTAKNRAESTPEFSIGRFLRDTYDELRKVVWPTWGELYRYTLVVLFTVVILGGFIGGVDYGLAAILKQFLYKAGQ